MRDSSSFIARRAAAAIAGAVLGGAVVSGSADAAENGAGIYLLGAHGPLAGLTPPPGLYLQNDVWIYSGSAGGSKEFVLGRTLALGVKGEGQLEAPTVLWIAPGKVLGGSFGFGAVWPIGRLYANAETSLTSPIFGTRSGFISDETSAYGDPLLTGLLGWSSGKFHWQAVALVNIPIGDYRKDALANVAFHRWAGDLTGTVTWLDPELGLDLSAAAGFTFNGENPETDYWTGTEFHLEWAASKSFGQFSIGMVGYHYRQVTGDGGPGATLGDFEGQVTALGGTVAYNFNLGDRPLTARLKVYREFAAENRMEGTSAFITLSLPLRVDASHPE